MPNIRSQSVDKDQLHIIASDGREVLITRAHVISVYQAQTGNAATRKQKALDAIKAEIVAALGATQVPLAILDFNFAEADAATPMTFAARGASGG